MFTVGIFAGMIPQVTTQTSQDVTSLSYRAFSELAQVYRSGTKADDLVHTLNDAINLIQQATVERLTGNETGANALDERARSTIEIVLAAAPAAQREAQIQSQFRTVLIITFVPLAVFLSTFLFVIALKIWRYHEHSKFYEMRIVEVEAQD
jgi:hypothetical protein